MQIVVDTNVFISALRSRRGASFRLLSLCGADTRFTLNVSVPLVLEYEAVAKRQMNDTGLSEQNIDDIVDYLCSIANHRQIFFLWRPFLPDPKDDMVLELAVEARCDYIVTHNRRDFAGADLFGIQVVSPQEFLLLINDTQ